MSATPPTGHPVTAREKALKINLDPAFYGTFAEIGAGQEVVRWFFHVGAAAGTISKSISAYDMKVSDAIYGSCKRYVARERLQSMLDYEQNLNIERLAAQRGETTAFFTFADTVSARSFKGNNECHGWMGIKFQPRPGAPSSQILIHVNMKDWENAQQQEALGIVGVNLIYGARNYAHEPEKLLLSLLDALSIDRIEIDLIEFSGPEFAQVDNRIMSLRLVQLGLSGAAMFGPDGHVLLPSEVLHKKPVLVERGRFRPLTYMHLDMLRSARTAFEKASPDIKSGETVALMEITIMGSLTASGEVDLADFISRAEVIAATGYTVMITDLPEYYRLARYLWRYTNRPIGLAMGTVNLKRLFDESYYTKLDGGILESFGRLFKGDLRLFVYPSLNEAGALTGADDVDVGATLRPLYAYLRGRGGIVPLTDAEERCLTIHMPEVRAKISHGDASWEDVVPSPVAQAIKTRRLFGYKA